MEEDWVKKFPRFMASRHKDFTLWNMRIEALLESKDLLKVVLEDQSDEGNMDAVSEEMKLKVSKARMYLVQSLGDKPLRGIASEMKNPFVMYRQMKERYAKENAATRVQLQTKLHQTRFVEGTVMSDYVDELESIFSRLEAMGSPIEETMQIAVLFSSFGSTGDGVYVSVISALQTLLDEDLSWDKVTAGLLQEYDTRVTTGKEISAIKPPTQQLKHMGLLWSRNIFKEPSFCHRVVLA